MNVTICQACDSENRESAKFCDACGAKIETEVEVGGSQLQLAPTSTEDSDLVASTTDDGDDEGSVDSMFSADSDVPEAAGEQTASTDLAETEDEQPPASANIEDESPAADTDEGAAEAPETEEELPTEPPKAGYLVFPDNTEQPIPPSQWLIGRTDLAKFLPNPKQANEISRGHLTVFQEGDRFFIEDGTTMVQRKPSTNKTWLVRGSSRVLVTGTGRTELQDADEIDVAELVKLQFVVR